MAYGAILGQLVDAFTKGQTFSPETAALFGLGADSVPDDVLALLSKAALYKTVGQTAGLYDVSDNLLLKLPGVQIATGSYVGTGKYGQDNPNSLTFDGIPKMVCVFDSTGNGFTENGGGFIWIQGNVGSISYNDNNFTQIGNTLSWYTDTAQNQLNNSGKTYVYLALI